MTYQPIYVTNQMVRNFFNPSLSVSDVPDTFLLSRIESIETYIRIVYLGNSPVTDSALTVAALFLIAADLVKDPNLAKKYGSIKKEIFSGDYTYEILDAGGSNAEKWEKMGKEILNNYMSGVPSGRWNIKVVNE